jgi:class 3 adenylate cyclase/pimeloyl-ACP methyl ester carboxylesterase
MDITAWLRSLQLEQYEAAFHENHIDEILLKTLTDQDFRELGVASLGHRKRLASAIADLVAMDTRQPATMIGDADTPMASGQTSPAYAERRHLTVMFVDLVGSTALSAKLDPEDMQEIITTYQNTVIAGLERFAGYVGRFMGDGILAYFGWPRAHEDEAERAVRAGLKVVEAVAKLESPFGGHLAARVGIASGLVVVGNLIAHGAAQEEEVIGETPNLAARLQQLASPNMVVISASTRRLLGGVFVLIDMGKSTVKGIDKPVHVYQVVGEETAESRFDARYRNDYGALVGREKELDVLLDRWRLASKGNGQVVLLCGEPGIGKSRLVVTLRERLCRAECFGITYSCSPYHVNSALWPIIAQMEQDAGITRDDRPGTKLERLRRLLQRTGKLPDESVALFGELLGLAPMEHHAVPDLSPQQKKAHIFSALLVQMEAQVRRKPLLIILEDAQWLDPTSREFLYRVVDHVSQLPIMIVVTFRPEFIMPQLNSPHITLLGLNRLNQTEAGVLVSQVTKGRRLPPEVLAAILSRTEGMPLFIEDLTRMVLESDLMAVTPEGALELTGPLPPLAIPTTLQDSLMARLDRLAPIREVAQNAACIGREFDYDLILSISGLPRERIDEALDELIEAELLFHRGVPPNAVYCFKHALVRDAAYASLLKSRRQQTHAKIAQAIERIRPETASQRPEILAYHCIEGGAPLKGAHYLLEAGRLAKARHAITEAKSHLESCLALADQIGPMPTTVCGAIKRECLILLGDLSSLTDDLERANDRYRRAMEIATTEAERSQAYNRCHRLHFAYRKGAEIAFYEHGSGRKTIVFVNPLIYGLATFQPIVENLSEEFRIITVDCRGAGRSDPIVRPYPLRDHMEDLRSVVEAADAVPFVGVGISRGSNQLIRLAQSYPGMMARLMIVGMPLGGPSTPSHLMFNEEYLDLRRQAYLAGDTEALISLQARFIFTEPNSDEIRQMFADYCRRLPKETVLSFYDPDPDTDVSPLLDAVNIPTLVAHDGEDHLVPLNASKFITDHISSSQLYIFGGKGHLPLFSATDEFCAVLRDFANGG